jgi:CDP-diacylglycerol---glycerol-3-phosphate 3-phosphatidyltransferase
MSGQENKKKRTWFFANLANIITFIGMLTGMSATVILWLSPEYMQVIVILFGLTALSDKLDGFVARKLDIVSSSGKALDRMRDKIFNCSMLWVLMVRYLEQQGTESPSALTATILVVLVIAMEILLTFSLCYGIITGKETGAGVAGKIKVVLQYCVIGLWLASLLAEQEYKILALDSSIWLINLMLLVTAGFAYGSLARYYRLHFNGQPNNQKM